MSAINSKRKKYSWLPESNPSAVSGEPNSAQSGASSTKSDGKSKKSRQPRQLTRVANMQRKKEREAATAAAAAGDGTPLEGLEIMSAETDTQASEPLTDGTPISAGVESEYVPVDQSPGVVATPQTETPKARRKHRKDSVDELVRSRLINSLNLQQDQQQQQNNEGMSAESLLAKPAASISATSRSRKHTESSPSVAVMSSITASVRDALVSERSHATSHHASPSQAQPNVTSAANTSTQLHQRPGPHVARQPHLFSYNGDASGNSTPGKHGAAMPSNLHLGSVKSSYSFPTYAALSTRNVGSTLKRGDHGVGHPMEYSNRGLKVTTGENVIVVHAGSRWLRIGRASDVVPKEVPHAIARRFRASPAQRQNGPGSAHASGVVSDAGAMEVDASGTAPNTLCSLDGMEIDQADASSSGAVVGPEAAQNGSKSNGAASESSDSDADELGAAESGQASTVDRTLGMLRDALKQHQRHSKRKVPPNAYSQVLTYNKQSRPETIQDHNDPFKIEWIMPSEIADSYVVGEKVLRLADSDTFIVRYPIRNGCFNVEDYASIEEVLGDIEAIWTKAITDELGIPRRELATYGVVLVIPDLFSRVEVSMLAEMLLRHIGFHYILVQQSSSLVTFGAGFSSACVVDVGAQKTSIACVEDGLCCQESRVNIMYGGDDITRFLHSLFMRSNFPYHEVSLGHSYDWNMINELRERHCTMNLSDVNIRLHNFFVRQPHKKHTQKYSFKTYDETYQAPFCLFYPEIVESYYSLPDYLRTFANVIAADTFADPRPITSSTGLLTPTQFGILPTRAVEEVGLAASVVGLRGDEESDEPLLQATTDLPATAPATVPATEAGTPGPARGPSAALPDQSGTFRISEALPAAESTAGAVSRTSPPTPVGQPIVSYEPDPQAQFSRMPLDLAITHSIVHAGSTDRVKKLYSSIVVVGGGVSFLPGFDELLASRLMYVRPDYLKGVVERADIVSAPRDLDPRVLAWKGGAVLSRLECAKDMWISSQEWADFGSRLLRDRVLFQW